MHKSLLRKFMLVAVIGMFSGALAYATPTPIPQSVTGGDPVPTSPHAVTTAVILTLLQAWL